MMSDAAEAPPPPATDQGDVGTPSSLSSHKRSRDYGEQLKGLPPSDDEDGQNGTSLPASKRQKQTHSDGDAGSDLDDGEIVESSLGPDPPMSADHQSNTQAAHEPSEDGEIDSNLTDSQETEEPDQASFVDESGDRRTQHSGWNRGLSLGARTSFGKPATTLFPTTTPTKADQAISSPYLGRDQEDGHSNGVEEDGDNDDDDEKDKDYLPPAGSPGISESRPPTTFDACGDTWNFPPQRIRVRKASQPSAWNDRIQQWITGLLEANDGMADRITAEVVRVGFDSHMARKGTSILQGNKKLRRAAYDAAEKAIAAMDLEPLIRKCYNRIVAQKAKAARKIHVKSPGKPLDSDEELRQQRIYFPGAEDPSQHCLFCSAIGHNSRECPQLYCKFCGSQEHALFGCPMKQRCSKCRQLGHTRQSCQEKLALASEEQGGCAICGADHAEEWCSEIWRSFTPLTNSNKKVKDVPAFCYTCGAAGHYGPECGLPDRGSKVTGTTTWSQENRLLYVDHNSQDVAIAWVNVDQNEEFHILGRAKGRVHTHFTSSEESEEDLVHAPIKKPERRSQIKIASNIGSSGQGSSIRPRHNDQSQRRQGEREFTPPPPPPPTYAQVDGSSWQPPLPSGPPPGPPRNGFQGSLPSAPTSLPPRPPAFNQTGSRSGPSHRSGQNNRGGRGGRGGGRGRGRGRGR